MENESKKFNMPKNIDCLDERMNIGFRFTNNEAVNYLPEINQEDLENRKERYRILLGKLEVIDSKNAIVSIDAILEADEAETGYYEEGINEVRNINITAIQRLVSNIKDAYPEYKKLELVGDIHTHPVTTSEMDTLGAGQTPCDPSRADFVSLVSAFERNLLKADQPFIFGIAGLDEKGKTNYAFYRIFKSGNNYGFKKLEKI